MNAYSELVRRDPRVSAKAFTFSACSGAKLTDMVASLPRASGSGKEAGQWGEKAQLEKIAPAGSADPSVSLVTFSIGGNDFGFAHVIQACVGGFHNTATTASCSYEIAEYKTVGTKIFNYGGAVHVDENGDGDYTLCSGACTSSWDVHIPSFANLLAQVHSRAPNARIIVVGYPYLFPASHTGNCTVGSVLPGVDYSITPTNMGIINAAEQYADNLIRGIVWRAASQGLNVRFADPRAAFNGHDVCQVHDGTGQPQTHAWINGLLFNFPANISSYSFHPNAAGQKAYTGVVAACYASVPGCGSDPR